MNCPQEEGADSSGPIWVSEPFRLWFPLGLVAAIFGLFLWPMHYFGWWPVYPAIQHPRILIFGFGAAFVIGFLGTAWPRFVEASPMRRWEMLPLLGLWACGQVAYAKVAIRGGDWFIGFALLWFLCLLGTRALGRGRVLPPTGLLVAYFGVGLGALVAFGFALGWNFLSPAFDHLLRLVSYQGFLLLPILGVGSFLFPRFFPGDAVVASRMREVLILATVIGILGSFLVEAYGSVRWGNLIRIAALMTWGAVVGGGCLLGRGEGTRSWALQVGLWMIVLACGCRVIWPREIFAFEHILFVAGFTQVMLVVADRVAIGHGDDPGRVPSRSLRWRWIVWLLLLTAATRAAADLVPSTRISHHIYAAIMLTVIFGIWWWENGKGLGTIPEGEGE